MNADLVKRIEAGSVILTPNRRLAAYLRREFDLAQRAAGKTVWPTADILPYQAFLERTWDELAGGVGELILLLPQQEIALWERVIDASPQADVLLGPAATARAARDAWAIRHGYRIDPAQYGPILDEDATAFAAWGADYAERCAAARWTDSARLPDTISAVLKTGARVSARGLVRCGFDAFSPQQQALFETLAGAGYAITDAMPPERRGQIVRRGYPDPETELSAVARQARELLATNANVRVGVVVPDLTARRSDVIRVFDDVLEPDRVLAAARDRVRPFNVSLGLPLTAYPLVHAALLILRFASGELPLSDAGVLLRSPFLDAAEQEFAARALVDGELRRRGRSAVTPGGLLHATRGRHPSAAPRLAALLEGWLPAAREARRKRQAPSAWSTTFFLLLKGLGWPGERPLDSEEYQAFEKFREVISGFSVLDPVSPILACADALSALGRLAADAMFQPQSAAVPVQVLGMLEAAGHEFDHLFVTGLSDDVWPVAPRPNPFLPVSVQRALGVPHASARWALEFARRTTRQWLNAADRVTLSWPRRRGERDLKASPLIAGVPEGALNLASGVFFRDAVYAARRVETLADFAAPALAAGIRVAGGSRFFKNQAACPFRGFAAHRLGAAALERGHEGLDPRERGSLVHQAAANFWRAVGSHARLAALNGPALHSVVEEAVAGAVDDLRRSRPDIMTDAFAALERTRVGALLARLAAVEKTRAPFEVLASERQHAVRVAGVELAARLDRVDRVAGGRLILDYKTGRAHIGDWLGERPDEPQLPLYAVAAQDVCGVSFVQLHTREVAFKGLVRDTAVLAPEEQADAWKGVKNADDWDALLRDWRAVLERLAREFLDGRADVAPKSYPATCRHCDFGLLCRVGELMDRGPVTPEEEHGDE
ncbi:MAG: PD-(D/E)XK nuclease family protein [Betaproteobacteria bacterium]|nr:PD-(D/E)XK nuclease family protein [Betaproteobacteria bacterium]